MQVNNKAQLYAELDKENKVVATGYNLSGSNTLPLFEVKPKIDPRYEFYSFVKYVVGDKTVQSVYEVKTHDDKKHQALITDFIQTLNKDYDENVAKIIGEDSALIVGTFADQAKLAQGIVDNKEMTDEDLSLINDILIEGETKEAWANKVIHVKAPLFKKATFLAIGIKRQIKKELEYLLVNYNEKWMTECDTIKLKYEAEKQKAIGKFEVFSKSLLSPST